MIKKMGRAAMFFSLRIFSFSFLILAGCYALLAFHENREHEEILISANLPESLGDLVKHQVYTDQPNFEVTRTYLIFRLPDEVSGLAFCGRDGFGEAQGFYFHPLAVSQADGCQKWRGGQTKVHLTDRYVLITSFS